jgi:outer membrane protein assembly factor BamD
MRYRQGDIHRRRPRRGWCATGTIAALLLAALGGCSSKVTPSAHDHFKSASEELQVGAYARAVDAYRAMLDEHPFSEHTEDAELLIGVAQYQDGQCPEATATFTDFQRRHPTSPNLPLVGYLLGQCAERLMGTADRDQSASQNAHAYYQALIQQFPTSPYAHLASDRLDHTRETMANHEYDVALYYDKRGNEAAAATRIIDLVNRFEETDVAGTALVKLGEIYERQGETDKAILAYSAVDSRYPEHEAAERARQQLDTLLAGAAPPNGDPLALLRSETGRTRNLTLAQLPSQPVAGAKGRLSTPTSPSGFGIPGRSPYGGPTSGPFGGGGFGY